MDKSQTKKIILQSKPKLIFNLIVSWSFAIMSAWVGYGFGFVFFGLCAVVFTYPLFDPKKKIIFKVTDEYKEQNSDDVHFLEQFYHSDSITCTELGFGIETAEFSKTIKWREIQALFAYKSDKWAVDDIRLDIFIDDKTPFTITEEILGWGDFLDKIEELFPNIDKDWYTNILVPAFETNLTLLYEKENKTLKEAITIYYKN